MAEQAAQQRDADAMEHQAGEHGGNPIEKGTKKVEGKLQRHRDLITISLALVGVLIGYMTLKGKSGKPAAQPQDQATDPAADDPFSDSAQYTSGGAYPSMGNVDGGSGDPTTGFAAYLSNISDSLDALNANSTSTGDAWTRPTSYGTGNWADEPDSEPGHFLYGDAAQGLSYIRNAANGFLYQVNPNGKQVRISAAQYAALGNPGYTSFGRAPAVKKIVKKITPKRTPKPKPKPKTKKRRATHKKH